MSNTSNTFWVNNLRSAITVLVVAHHGTLAYTTFASFNKDAYINSTHAVVDRQQWIGLDILENFNDIFFMSLMFFIGGLFLIKSISNKGVIDFIYDRFLRLFIPFIIGGTFLMLLAYIPSYIIAKGSFTISAYCIDFFTVESWPVGPPWFIWVLFAFNLIFAILWVPFKGLYTYFGIKFNQLKNPIVFLFIFYSLTWVLLVPLSYSVGAGTWTGWGPFDFQLSRILLYFGYFTLGICIGASNSNTGLFGYQSSLVKYRKLWCLLALSMYALLTVTTGNKWLEKTVIAGTISEFTGWMMYFSMFTASCVLSCIAFITTFKTISNYKNGFWLSLHRHAYLIYLIHFVFITWLQWALLNVQLPAVAKFVLVFMGSLTGSWLISILLKKIPYLKNHL